MTSINISFPENVTDDPDISVHDSCIKLKSVKTANPFCRFGHVTTSLGSDWLMSVGGFGEQGGKHLRVTDVTLANSRTWEIFNIDPKVNNREIEGAYLPIQLILILVIGKL